jgi:hypothetical protein
MAWAGSRHNGQNRRQNDQRKQPGRLSKVKNKEICVARLDTTSGCIAQCGHNGLYRIHATGTHATVGGDMRARGETRDERVGASARGSRLSEMVVE